MQALLVFMYIFIRYEVTVNGLVLLISIPGGSDSKASAYNAEDLGSIPGLGRSPGEGNGNPLCCSCLDNPHGQRNLVGCSPWGCKESDTTERLNTLFLIS